MLKVLEEKTRSLPLVNGTRKTRNPLLKDVGRDTKLTKSIGRNGYWKPEDFIG